LSEGSESEIPGRTELTAGGPPAGASVARARSPWLQTLASHYWRYGRLMRLHRPIGTWLLLWPTLWAEWIATAGKPQQDVFLILVIGTIVARSADSSSTFAK